MRIWSSALVTLLSSAFLLAAHAQPNGEPENVRLARLSFEALDAARSNHDYAPALKASNVCVSKFGKQADGIEAALRKHNVPILEPRDVGPTPADRAAVFFRGPLNDVAACLFVKVASEVALKHADVAQSSYAQLCRYPHALVWDPKGWFWSPAQGARGELQSIGLSPALCPE
jgi:hypothetical protein